MTGAPIEWDGAPPVLQEADDDTIVHPDTGVAWTLAFDRDPALEFTPVSAPAASSSGSYVLAREITPSTQAIAILRDDGSGEWRVLPDGWQLVASDIWGTVVGRMDAGVLELAWVLTGDDATARDCPAAGVDVMRRGDGPCDSVRELQTLLTERGFTGDVDGVFGAATEDAVRAFQAAHGLEVDGLVGPATWRALNTWDVVAIDGDGAAVLIRSGTVTVLHDGGSDPDDPPPSEGESVFVDAVTIAPDGRTAVVSYCCEPIAGSLVAVSLADLSWEHLAFGHVAAFTTSGQLVIADPSTIRLLAPNGATVAVVEELDPGLATAIDLAVAPSQNGVEEVLALLAGPAGTLLTVQVAGAGDMIRSTLVSDSTWLEPYASLAGVTAERIFVRVPGEGVHAFDRSTLRPVPEDDRDVDWIGSWLTDDGEIWIDPDRRLFVDGEQIPGEYLWARPA